jgi:hypothetical protein
MMDPSILRSGEAPIETPLAMQGGFDGQIGLMALSTRRCSRLGLPTGDRFGREPDGEAAAITQGCIILSQVRDPMTLVGNAASAFRIPK